MCGPILRVLDSYYPNNFYVSDQFYKHILYRSKNKASTSNFRKSDIDALYFFAIS